MKKIRIIIFNIMLVAFLAIILAAGVDQKNVKADVTPQKTEKIYLFKSEFIKIEMDATYTHKLSDASGKQTANTKTYKVDSKGICRAELSGNNNKQLKITALTGSGSVDVYVWNEKCTKCFRKITVIIVPTPSLTLNKNSLALWENGTAELTASVATVNKSVEYTWQTGSKSLLQVTGNKDKCKVEVLKPAKNEVVSVTCKAKVYSSKGSKEVTKTINAYVFPNPEIVNKNLTVNSWIGDKAVIPLEIKGNASEYIWKIKDYSISSDAITDTDKKTVVIHTDKFSKNTEFTLIAMAKYTCSAGTKAVTKEFKVNLYKKPTLTSISNEFQNKGNEKSKDVYLYEGQSARIEMKTDGNVSGYTWVTDNNDGILLNGNSEKSCTVKAMKKGEYTVDGYCFYDSKDSGLGFSKSNSKSVKIIVLSKPVLHVYSDNVEISKISICEGEKKRLSYLINNMGTEDAVSAITITSSATDKVKTGKNNNDLIVEGVGCTYDKSIDIIVEAKIKSPVSENNGTEYGLFSKKIEVTVLPETKIPVMSIVFENKDKILTVGDVIQLKTQIFPTDATFKAVDYKCNNIDVLSVDETGLLYCKKCGVATVKVISKDDNSVNAEYTVKVICQTPRNLKILNNGSNTLLMWGAVNGAKKYDIYRSVDGKEYTKIGNVNGTTGFQDNDIIYGKKIKYKIKAEPYEGNAYVSGFSSEASITVSVPKTNIKKVINKKDEIILKWNKTTSASGYELYRSTDKNRGFEKIAFVTDLSYSDKNAKCGKKYYYKIKTVIVNSKADFGNVKKIKHSVLKPVIKYATNSKGVTKLKIKKYKYDGYVIYIGKSSKSRRAIADIKTNSARLNTGNYKGAYCIWVKAYKTIDGKRVYSKVSNAMTLCI